MAQSANKNGRIHQLIFVVLTIVLGMQANRMFIGLLLYVLRDNLGYNANIAGLLAFLVFTTSFLVGSLRQRFGLTPMWRYPALILGPLLILTNIIFNQTTSDSSPLITLFPLFLTIIAVAAFLQFLPNYLLQHRHNLPFFAYGTLLGLAADTALHGAVLTYDFVWHHLVALLLIFATQLAFLLLHSSQDNHNPSLSLRWPWAFMLLGPYVFLQMLIFQNVARLTAVSGWPFPWAFIWIMLTQIVGLITAVILSKRQTNLIDCLVFALLLIFSTIGQTESWAAAAQQFAGQIGSAALLIFILSRMDPQSETSPNHKHNMHTVTLAYGLGFVLNVIFSFAYYIPYDIPLPYSNTAVPTLSAILIATLALLGLRHQPTHQAIHNKHLSLSFFLLLSPLYLLVTYKTPQASPPPNTPLRVMTYNLHNGFHPYGYLDLEAIVQVIENENADIIALQEVSRGWIINGSVDMLTWLSQRLDMPYIFNPTTDPLWGNALFSRYPIISYQLYALPPDHLPLTRGFIAAKIKNGNDQTLNIIATHLHHPRSGGEIRQQQVQTIIDYAQDQPHTIIMGDLNADPNTPEMILFDNAGYTDILADVQPNFTFYSLNPDRQLDYIWLTPDLTADLITIPPIPASDHFGVAATIHP